eukprot:CAMPEP_0117690718 /NCGR_PEP_ID=MMETSP0804-20121206/25295_1 /TAXON_ID=1074897 /ORGANISM="Tetraselmis astigmatica, Strain CCMP880" /LENGTH=78 /DNA_ID=CAMNT_0005503821 /DNA_START=383 /DNA_END=619 /DNA_ORIENTATION=-
MAGMGVMEVDDESMHTNLPVHAALGLLEPKNEGNCAMQLGHLALLDGLETPVPKGTCQGVVPNSRMHVARLQGTDTTA